MRLIGTLKNETTAHLFSQFLTNNGIENQCEPITITDWDNPEYGDRHCRIWIIDEDQLNRAYELYTLFEQDPSHPRFSLKSTSSDTQLEELPIQDPSLKTENTKDRNLRPEPLGPVTLYLILICILLFFWGGLSTPRIEQVPGETPFLIAATSPIKKTLLYDYPAAYEKLDQFVQMAQEGKWSAEKTIPVEGRQLLREFETTPYWQGLYAVLVKYLREENWQELLTAPKFEKIQQGEMWRIASPALLHNDLIHILFNMLWLVVLGKLMEKRLGSWRYLLFCLLVAAFSNTAQYLMSGANFIGISGVLCGMLAYIWVRTREAPWEGYQIQSSTFTFLMLFILAMLSLQIVSFFGEVYWSEGLFSGIANTAHLSGALGGYILGKMHFFAWQRD